MLCATCLFLLADIFKHVFGTDPWAQKIHQEILSSYLSATCFFHLSPAMPMPDFPHLFPTGPIADLGQNQAHHIQRVLGLPQETRLVLVGFGGFDKDIPFEKWQVVEGVHWLIPDNCSRVRQDMTPFSLLPFSFSDLITSVDATLTKPGYGTFVEAACAGVGVLYLPRKNWPEQEALITWLHQHTRALALDEEDFYAAHFPQKLRSFWAMRKPPLPQATGAQEIARYLLAHI